MAARSATGTQATRDSRAKGAGTVTTQSFAGMWVTADGHIRHELLPNGRYDEARGSKRSAYRGPLSSRGSHIDYVDDTGFTADGDFVDGVLIRRHDPAAEKLVFNEQVLTEGRDPKQTGRSALCRRTKLACDRHHLCRLYTLGIRWQGQVCVGPAHAVLPRSNRLWTLRSLGYECRHDLWFRSIDGVAPCRFHWCRPCTLGPEALRCRREGDLMGLDADPPCR